MMAAAAESFALKAEGGDLSSSTDEEGGAVGSSLRGARRSCVLDAETGVRSNLREAVGEEPSWGVEVRGEARGREKRDKASTGRGGDSVSHAGSCMMDPVSPLAGLLARSMALVVCAGGDNIAVD